MRIDPTEILLAMLDLEMTREETCARARISRDTLRKIEAGRLVSLKSLKRLCLCLGIKSREVLVNAATPAQAQRPEDLGDRRGTKENEHGHNAPGARRESVRELLSARQGHHGKFH